MHSTNHSKTPAIILVKLSCAFLLSLGSWFLQSHLAKVVEKTEQLHLIEAIVLLSICAIILLLFFEPKQEGAKEHNTLVKTVGFIPETFKNITLIYNLFMSSYCVILVLNAFIKDLTIPNVDIFLKFASHIIPFVFGFYLLSLIMPICMYLLSPTHQKDNSGGGQETQRGTPHSRGKDNQTTNQPTKYNRQHDSLGRKLM